MDPKTLREKVKYWRLLSKLDLTDVVNGREMHKAAHSLCKLSHMTKPSLFAKKSGMVLLSRTPDCCKILLFHPSIHPLL